MKIGIMLVCKNEGDYLHEWIAYHLALGVDTIFVYDNRSTDNTRDICSIYQSIGRLEYFYLDKEICACNEHRMHCINKYKNEYDIIGFIDVDEFIYSIDRDIKVTLTKLMKDTSVLSIPGLWIGKELTDKPDGFVTQNYFRTENPNGHRGTCKLFVRPKDIIRFKTAHIGVSKGASNSEFIKGKRSYHPILKTKFKSYSLRYYHYNMKSLQEFLGKDFSTHIRDNKKFLNPKKVYSERVKALKSVDKIPYSESIRLFNLFFEKYGFIYLSALEDASIIVQSDTTILDRDTLCLYDTSKVKTPIFKTDL